MEDTQKTILFEQTPIPRAVMKLAVPTIISSLVMIVYNLADTYFVGMLNNPVENAAVTLAAPGMFFYRLYHFQRTSFSIIGSKCRNCFCYRRISQMDRFLWCRSCHIECGHGIFGACGGLVHSCKYRYHERMSFEYRIRSRFYSSVGIKYGGSRCRICYFSFKLRCMHLFFYTSACKAREDLIY